MKRALLLLAIVLSSCSYFTPTVKPEHKLSFTSGEVCDGLCVGQCMPYPSPTPGPTPIPSPTPVPVPTGSVRGVSCLHCTLPKALLSANSVVETITKADISRPAISFLVSGTFGWNFDYVNSAARRIKTATNFPVVELFWQSGPSQRRWQSGFFNGIGDKTPPGTWNNQLQHDSPVRSQVVTHLQKVSAVASDLLSMGVVPVIGALEDNFDDATMHAVEGLMHQAGFPAGTEFVRNADGYLPQGWHHERHGSGRAVCNNAGDIWSNDGYNMDNGPLEALSYYQECERVKGAALFHSPKNQGVVTGVPFKPVEQRDYHVMTAAEQDQIGGMLKQVFPVPSAALKNMCPNGFVSVQYPNLYKQSSDGTGAPREGKPGFIGLDQYTLKGTALVYNNEGAAIARFGWYGDYQIKWERSYICWGSGSCETKEQLASKASPAYIQARNGQCFGPIASPMYRQGAVK